MSHYSQYVSHYCRTINCETARRLTQGGWKLYVSRGDRESQDQIRMFSPRAIANLTIVYTDMWAYQDLTHRFNDKRVPFWRNERLNQTLEGIQSFATLVNLVLSSEEITEYTKPDDIVQCSAII